jgi:hypothetical protein
MKNPLTILIGCIACAVFAAFVIFSTSPMFRFQFSSKSYFKNFTKDCDKVLVMTPLGTNKYIRIATPSSLLPAMIRQLNPEYLTVNSNRLHIMVHSGHVNGYAIVWERSETDHTEWILSAGGEGAWRDVYKSHKQP